MSADSSLEEIINQNHAGDEKQLEIIFSSKDRIVVEAPAGCGKTSTMVSKVAYLIAKKKIPKNKKMLALTFSVNAAYKMKKDIAEKLPAFGLNQVNTPKDLNRLIYISNYHGLCRRIISLYGYLFDERLKDINNFKAMNENDYKSSENFEEYGLEISEDEKVFFSKFNKAVLNCDKDTVETLEEQYCEVLKNKFLKLKCITYNGYLVLAKWLLSNNTELLRFYQRLYSLIIIDEFQDTNFLSWNFICTLINDETKLFFMGDSLQRIYGFIGAIPNILEKAQIEFSMDKIEMVKNYRFENNPDMLLLDKNIRENAKNIIVPQINNDAKINLHFTKTQEEESQWVVCKW